MSLISTFSVARTGDRCWVEVVSDFVTLLHVFFPLTYYWWHFYHVWRKTVLPLFFFIVSTYEITSCMKSAIQIHFDSTTDWSQDFIESVNCRSESTYLNAKAGQSLLHILVRERNKEKSPEMKTVLGKCFQVTAGSQQVMERLLTTAVPGLPGAPSSPGSPCK